MNAEQLLKQIQRGKGWITDQEIERIANQENLSTQELIFLVKSLLAQDMIRDEEEEKDMSIQGIVKEMVKNTTSKFQPNERLQSEGWTEEDLKESYNTALKEVEASINDTIMDEISSGESSGTFSWKSDEETGDWFDGLNKGDIYSGISIHEIAFDWSVKHYQGSYDSPADTDVQIPYKSIVVKGAFLALLDDGGEEQGVERDGGLIVLHKDTDMSDVEDMILDHSN